MRNIVSFFLLAFITLVPPSQCRNDQTGSAVPQTLQAEQRIAQGDMYFAQGLYDQALDEYNAAIEFDPGLAMAYWGRGRVYHFDRGLYSKAVDDYSRVVELNPAHTEVYYYRGLAHIANGVYDRAIANFTRIIELDPGFSMAYNLRALCYVHKAQWDQSSQQSLSRLLDSDPGLAEVYRGEAWSFVRKPQWELFTVPLLAKDAAEETVDNNVVSTPEDKQAIPQADKGNSPASPYVRVIPLSGTVGSQIFIYGWGFRGNEDGITVTWDGEIILCNVRAEIDGSLIIDGSKIPFISSAFSGDTRAAVYVPVTTSGWHILGVYGSSFTPIGIVNDTFFEVTPEIKLSIVPDIKGIQMKVSGAGFASGEVITFNLDNKRIEVMSTTDGTGSFKVSFVTPTIKGNEYTITASGDKGSFAQANFIVPLAKPLPTGQKPDIAEVYSNRGYAHFKKAQWAQVIDSLDAAYAKHASLDRGSWNKQWALDKQQQWDVVIADYNRVTAIIDGAMPQQDSPDANVLKNELELALADYTRAARISKNPAFVNTTGNIMTYIQQWGRDVANINLSPHD